MLCVTSAAPIIPSVPTGGNLPLASAIASVPLLQMACSTVASGSGTSSVTSVLAAASWLVTPQTPLVSLTQAEPPSSKSKKAIVIGSSYRPIPYKIAEVIWRDQYLDLAELLPVRLGAPEPTLLELFSGSQNKTARAKKGITNIEECVPCFNAYIAIVAQKRPERVPDLLAYLSLIVKAYEETPRLGYDQHYRCHEQRNYPRNGELSSQKYGRCTLAMQEQSSGVKCEERLVTLNVKGQEKLRVTCHVNPPQ